MSGNRQVKFEVYAMQGGRWNIHAHFDSSDRDGAVDEAMRVERQSGVSASCVMRSSYNSISNESTDTVIYHSPSLSGRPSVASLSKGGGRSRGAVLTSSGEGLAPPPGSAAANAAADYARRDQEFQIKQRKDSSALRAVGGRGKIGATPDFLDPYEEVENGIDLVKLSLAFVVSSMVATASSGIVYFGVRTLEINMGRNAVLIALAATFGVTFLALFVPMVKKIVENSKVNNRTVNKTKPTNYAFVEPSYNTTVQEPIDVSHPNPEETQDIHDEGYGHDVENATPAEDLIFDLGDVLRAHLDEGEIDSRPEDEDDFFPENNVAKPASDIIEEPSSEITLQPITNEQPSPNRLNDLLMVLVNEVSQNYGATLRDDAYLRFGAILFLAGAVEIMARDFGVRKKEYIQLLIESVTKIGAEPAHARGFCANIDEYLLDERYLGMYGAGRNAGKAKLKSAKAISGFIDWMEYWKNPATQAASEAIPVQDGAPEGKRFIAVLFTDIVDSTSKQQEMGDEWMMQVVRAHNKAVRTALKSYGGREVKHLGDGIMASFPAVAEAVAASIAMQRGFGEACELNPDLQFSVRVGISAGEPIHESGDIFGTPVNLAARILSEADAGEIAVSSLVKDMCAGKSFDFREIGEVKLKGFSQPQMIFHVNLN